MTVVRTCPACSDTVAAGDVFCEGCGRTLPDDVREARDTDAVATAPQESLADHARPGLVSGDGAPTAPQVSLGGLTLSESLSGDSEWDAIDAMATQPVRRARTTGAPEAVRGRSQAAPTPAPDPEEVAPEWPPPATGSNPVQPTNPGLCVWCPGTVLDGYCEKCGFLQPTGRDHVEVRTPSAVGVSDRGLRHRRNEDAMAIRVVDADAPHAPGSVVAVVCDGVSSSPRSDEASRITAETGATVLAERLRRGEDPRTATGAAMTRAAEAVAAIAESPSSAPACTYVSAVVDPRTGTTTIGWVGDSRAYWLSGAPTSSASALLTKDDSWSEAMVQAGALSREEAMRSANAHALIAWMGADSGEIDAHISTVTPTGPGAVVLCSDGLWNYYPQAQALTDAVPGAGAEPHAAARTYVSLALQAGGKDNITVVVIPVPIAQGGSRAEQA